MIYDRIRLLREKSGLSQAELAKNPQFCQRMGKRSFHANHAVYCRADKTVSRFCGLSARY